MLTYCLTFFFFFSYLFHYICHDRIIYLCITDDVSISSQIHFCTHLKAVGCSKNQLYIYLAFNNIREAQISIGVLCILVDLLMFSC